MLQHVAYATMLVFATTVVHAACTTLVLAWIRSINRRHWSLRSVVTRGSALGVMVFLMAQAALIESGLWAGFYVWVGALPNFSDAFYFSLVTFTTLGYGDITLGESWRLLAGFQSANGIIIFGWTTALVVAAANRVFFHGSTEPDGS